MKTQIFRTLKFTVHLKAHMEGRNWESMRRGIISNIIIKCCIFGIDAYLAYQDNKSHSKLRV